MYVGSAKNLRTRWGEHRKLLTIEKHFNRHLQHAWLKYGEEAFTYTIKEKLGEYNKKFFFEKENNWIDLLRAEGKVLFNIARAEGGWGPDTFSRKAEICAKISASLLTHTRSLTAEQRKIIYGKGKKGIPLSIEHKRKTAAGLIGKKKSAKTRQVMSLAQHRIAIAHPQKAENMSRIGKQNIGRVPKNAKPIIFRGIEFSSAPACRRETGLTMHQILKEVYGPNYRKEKEEV